MVQLQIHVEPAEVESALIVDWPTRLRGYFLPVLEKPDVRSAVFCRLSFAQDFFVVLLTLLLACFSFDSTISTGHVKVLHTLDVTLSTCSWQFCIKKGCCVLNFLLAILITYVLML